MFNPIDVHIKIWERRCGMGCVAPLKQYLKVYIKIVKQHAPKRRPSEGIKPLVFVV